MRLPTSEHLILQSVKDRLLDQLDEFGEGSILVTDTPWPGTVLGAQMLTITPRDGGFDARNFTGGGHHVVTEHSSLVVSYYSLLMQDAPNRIEYVTWRAPGGGWVDLKRRILKALLVDWEPEHDGKKLLRDMMSPLGSMSPREFQAESVGRVIEAGLQFAITWDWDLS